ncbi:Hsp20/alpha crystallin family protein [Patescibacteria group bacterium]|nr:MAG: Hsp20/alpha crystallin family protein [Patescibacteria group bacterium]
MSKTKKSFFERLTGTIRLDDDTIDAKEVAVEDQTANWLEEEEKDGELTVDVHQTADKIIVKTMVAGVRPEDLDISITRDMVTIRGKREEERSVKDEDFFYRELYWGSFSRTISLPQEVEIDTAEAIEKHGLLILKLTKVDKGRQTKVRVKSNL